MFKFEELKERHRATRDSFGASISLRTHRALSWLKRSEQETEDADAAFVFLWIAFNAAYANEIHDRKLFSERKLLLRFLRRLVDIDDQRLLYELVWNQFPKSIRVLLHNKYVFQPYWEYHSGRLPKEEWINAFERSNNSANRALGRTDTTRVLAEIFDRLYTLRNQIIHGGATWNSGINRSQIKDGASILGFLVPTIIHLMMQNHDQVWGEPCYPVVD